MQVAHILRGARESFTTVASPSSLYPDLTIDDAYEIQQQLIDEWVASGAKIKGFKVGLTSRAMQEQLGVDQPDFGQLLDDMFQNQDTPIRASAYLQPKIEPEIAFVMGSELKGPGVCAAEAEAAVDHVVASLEIIDSRVTDWRITIVDTIADNASSAGVVTGQTPLKLSDIDLASIKCRLLVDAQPVASGVGQAVMGDPINALVWLANTLGARGIGFRPGDVVMPGSLTAAQPVRAGSVVRAEFDGLGPVTATFV